MKILLSMCIGLLALGSAYSIGQVNIASVPFTISTPGSYIVVKDLQVTNSLQTAISINTSDVTIDLNGHTLYGLGTSGGGSGKGIFSWLGNNNITVTNGCVRDFPSQGIWIVGDNNQISHIKAYNNGDLGIGVGVNGMVNDNMVENNVGGVIAGNNSIIRSNTINSNVYYGISAQFEGISIIDNTLSGNGAFGIYGGNNDRVSGNTIRDSGTTAIYLESGCKVSNNVLQDNGGGIIISGSGTIEGNNLSHSGSSTGQDGILVTGTDANINNNTIIGSAGWGINAQFYCNIQNNEVNNNTLGGIYVTSYGYISKNNLVFNIGDGIRGGSSNRISENNCFTSGYGYSTITSGGIHITGTGNTIENNLLNGNDRGLQIDTSGNYFAGNRFRSNTIDIVTSAGNTSGNGLTGFQNIIVPYSQNNIAVRLIAGYEIPVLRESTQGILREVRW